MIRNLLYSLFLHFLILVFLYFGDLGVLKKEYKPATPVSINFVDLETLQDIENQKPKNSNDKYKNLQLNEKLELYNLAKNAKKSEDFKNKNKIYSSKEDKSSKKALSKDDSLEDENTFSYYSYLVYVNEKKVTAEEKERIEKNQQKKKKLRDNIKENPNIDKAPPGQMKDLDSGKSIQDIIKVSQKPVIIDNRKTREKLIDETEEKNKDLDTTNENEANQETENYEREMEDLNDLIFASERKTYRNIELKEVNLSEIFSKDDYKNIKTINNGDNRYDLTIREKINIQRDIKSCYKRAILKSGMDSKSIVSITVKVERDGSIDLNKIKVENPEQHNGKNEKDFKIALENAKVALVFCSPLRNLPSAKYRVWREMNFVFDSSNLE